MPRILRSETPLLTSLLLVGAGVLPPAGAAAAAPPAEVGPRPSFKIYVADFGVYRLTFEDLVAAGLPDRGLPSDALELTQLGEPVPIWVEDGGDGRFDPGDRIELVGERLRGEVSYYSETAYHNVYRLRTDASGGARMKPRPPAAQPDGATRRLFRVEHHEEDALFIRLPPASDGPEELWFWTKVIGGYPPFELRFALPDLARGSGEGVDLRIHLRGWSQPRYKGDEAIPDHAVDVSLNGETLTQAIWNGPEPYLLEIPGVPPSRFVEDENLLALSSPKRLQADGEALIDVILLNWIEVVAPREGHVGERQVRLHMTGPAGPVRLLGDPGEELLVYGESGWRASSRRGPADGSRAELTLDAEPGEESVAVTWASRLVPPAAIALDRPSRLRDADRQADYVMIVHRRLREALVPLAELHRRRGLTVTVVDVEDVYDELSHGVRDPLAVRRFLDHAYHHWPRPAPRFVLLVGDASWDARNELAIDANYADWGFQSYEIARFVKNRSTPYAAENTVNNRNYVPTLSYLTNQGHAASDNGFVAVDGDDDLPDMAIGRFPVIEPSEVAAIVEKTKRYVEEVEPGPWQRRAVFITNEAPGFQKRSDQAAAAMAAAGYEPLRVYPESSETSNERNTARLIEAFDSGALFVHFYGHGGRYIWRTGPVDLKKNHDLLTLEHLDRLKPTPHLPVVLSLTCYSAPFDHPGADSIGEKLLRLAERGAVGVIAASWRNGAQVRWGQVLLEELTTPGATVGEALMRAKRRVRQSEFVHTYNLLGDPAVPVALPGGAAQSARSSP
jgi:hypothetical protein